MQQVPSPHCSISVKIVSSPSLCHTRFLEDLSLWSRQLCYGEAQLSSEATHGYLCIKSVSTKSLSLCTFPVKCMPAFKKKMNVTVSTQTVSTQTDKPNKSSSSNQGSFTSTPHISPNRKTWSFCLRRSILLHWIVKTHGQFGFKRRSARCIQFVVRVAQCNVEALYHFPPDDLHSVP